MSYWQIAAAVLNIGSDLYSASQGEMSSKQLRTLKKARRAEAGQGARAYRREAKLTQSRAQAVLAFQGGALDDPTAINVQGDIAAEGEYRALNSLYEGELEAKGIGAQESAVRSEGRARAFSSVSSAFSTAVDLSKYDVNKKYG